MPLSLQDVSDINFSNIFRVSVSLLPRGDGFFLLSITCFILSLLWSATHPWKNKNKNKNRKWETVQLFFLSFLSFMNCANLSTYLRYLLHTFKSGTNRKNIPNLLLRESLNLNLILPECCSLATLPGKFKQNTNSSSSQMYWLQPELQVYILLINAIQLLLVIFTEIFFPSISKWLIVHLVILCFITVLISTVFCKLRSKYFFLCFISQSIEISQRFILKSMIVTKAHNQNHQ